MLHRIFDLYRPQMNFDLKNQWFFLILKVHLANIVQSIILLLLCLECFQTNTSIDLKWHLTSTQIWGFLSSPKVDVYTVQYSTYHAAHSSLKRGVVFITSSDFDPQITSDVTKKPQGSITHQDESTHPSVNCIQTSTLEFV